MVTCNRKINLLHSFFLKKFILDAFLATKFTYALHKYAKSKQGGTYVVVNFLGF